LALKKFLIVILGLFINSSLFPQQILFEIGDNIVDYLNKNPTSYMTQGKDYIDSPDGKIDFLKYKAETTDIDTKFLSQ